MILREVTGLTRKARAYCAVRESIFYIFVVAHETVKLVIPAPLP